MRNVDRDVLLEAIELAEFKDLFPLPSEEILTAIATGHAELTELLVEELRQLKEALENLAEKNELLEKLAFGSVVLKLIRTVMFLSKVVPGLFFIGLVFMVVERVFLRAEMPTMKDITEITDELGITDLLTKVKGEIAETFAPHITALKQFQSMAKSVFEDLQFNTETELKAIQSELAVAIRDMNTDRQVAATVVVSWLQTHQANLQGMDNLVGNFDTFLLEGRLEPAIRFFDQFIEEQTGGTP